ncbi:MAG: patatin-like phospholipase family protein [Propionibacteriales bacterium]|nr:patatin-like phospholipase family protein [Propionibacteriales bacterium]
MNQNMTPRDVFVLSGGAARGAVQVGMMQTLLEAGITPSGLVGTSVGALNAAFMGWRPDRDRVDELAERWQRLTTKDIFPGGNWARLAHLAQRHSYLFSSDALQSLIQAWIPVSRLEDLPTPVRVTTTPLASAAVAYHDSGPIERLLLASAAVPGVFAPVVLADAEGHTATHVDGGVADLIPVAGASHLNPTRVFVLDATVPARLPHARTPIEIIVASLSVAMRARAIPDLGAGVEIHHLVGPDLGTSMTDFSRTAEHIALGRTIAAELVDRLARESADGQRGQQDHRRTHRFWDRFHAA